MFNSSRLTGEPARHPAAAPCLYATDGRLFLECRDGVRLQIGSVLIDGAELDGREFQVRFGAQPWRFDFTAQDQGTSLMKKLLILGVNGFIGHHLSEAVIRETDWDVYGMDLESDRLANVLGHPRFHFFEGDITINREWVEYHIRKCDTLLPLVAIATPGHLYLRSAAGLRTGFRGEPAADPPVRQASQAGGVPLDFRDLRHVAGGGIPSLRIPAGAGTRAQVAVDLLRAASSCSTA